MILETEISSIGLLQRSNQFCTSYRIPILWYVHRGSGCYIRHACIGCLLHKWSFKYNHKLVNIIQVSWRHPILWLLFYDYVYILIHWHHLYYYAFVTRCYYRFLFSWNFDMCCNHYLILIPNHVTLSHTLSCTYID